MFIIRFIEQRLNIVLVIQYRYLNSIKFVYFILSTSESRVVYNVNSDFVFLIINQL